MKNEFSPLSLFDAYQFTRTNERKASSKRFFDPRERSVLGSSERSKEFCQRYTLIYDSK
jgi:hypothetical protein